MSLEEKLAKAGIKKILVVDDKMENLGAAKEYFESLERYGIKTDYASSAEQAKEKIQQAYKDKEKYSVIISDLVMEEPDSGLQVIREGFKHQTYGFIATGRNHGHHGPFTYILPVDYNVNGGKEKPEVWQKVFEKVLEHLAEEAKPVIAALERYYKHVGMPSDSLADTAIRMYESMLK